jgi:hypothetical protein
VVIVDPVNVERETSVAKMFKLERLDMPAKLADRVEPVNVDTPIEPADKVDPTKVEIPIEPAERVDAITDEFTCRRFKVVE